MADMPTVAHTSWSFADASGPRIWKQRPLDALFACYGSIVQLREGDAVVASKQVRSFVEAWMKDRAREHAALAGDLRLAVGRLSNAADIDWSDAVDEAMTQGYRDATPYVWLVALAIQMPQWLGGDGRACEAADRFAEALTAEAHATLRQRLDDDLHARLLRELQSG